MDFTRASFEAAVASRLLPLARSWRRLADAALEERGVSAADGWALTHIARLAPDVRQVDLAEAMEIAPPSLVPLLARLEEAGLVTRIVDPQDRRTRRVALTERAGPIVTGIEQSLAALRRRVLADIDDDRLAGLAAALAEMSETAAALRGAS